MKNPGCDRYWICMYCFSNLFPCATIKLLQKLNSNNDQYDSNCNSNSAKTCPVIKLPIFRPMPTHVKFKKHNS